MSKGGLQPNNPAFYTPPEVYQPLENLISGSCEPVNQEEKAVYSASRENLEAFLKSQILDWTESPEEIAEAFSQIPGYLADDPQRESRRQLSAQAREQLLKLALNTHLSTAHISMHREYYLLLNRDDTPESHEENENIRKIMEKGSPKERGRLFEACIKNCMGWFLKSFTGISDREIVENLPELQRAQNMAVVAQNIRNLMDEKGLIKISEETRRLLKFMEDNSPWINAQVHRIRAISNPTYEHIGIDGFLELRYDDFDDLKDSLDGNTTGMWDYLNMISNVRINESLARSDNKATVKSCLKEVARANSGFFIGSSAYSQAFRSLRGVAKFLDNMDDYPNAQELAQAKPVLEEAIQKCSAYLERKGSKLLTSLREGARYNAMKHAMESCQKTLNFLTLKEQIKAAELRNDGQPDADLQVPVNPASDVSEKIGQLYGPKVKLIGLPISDAGTIADELRADIYTKLNQLVSEPDGFDAELAGYVMANMVVLEMVKNGRGVNENGEITAGPVEKELAADPGTVLESIRSAERIQNIMADVTPEKLNQFIMTGGAKNIADSMTKNAELRANSQNEQEIQIQKQNEMMPS